MVSGILCGVRIPHLHLRATSATGIAGRQCATIDKETPVRPQSVQPDVNP
jgi:DNA-binding transcriptional regulator YdaS (Cro superfamily)